MTQTSTLQTRELQTSEPSVTDPERLLDTCAAQPGLTGLAEAALAAGLDLHVDAGLAEDTCGPITAEEAEHGEYDDHGENCGSCSRPFRLRHPDGRQVHGVICEQAGETLTQSVHVGFHGLNIGGWVVPADESEEARVRALVRQGRCTDADVRGFVPLVHAVTPETLLALFPPGAAVPTVHWRFYFPEPEDWCSDAATLARLRPDVETLCAAHTAAENHRTEQFLAASRAEAEFFARHGFLSL